MEPSEEAETKGAESTIQKLQSRFLSDAILIALASAWAYLFSFLYERGYASYFGIPQEFINVSLINLLIFGAGVVTFLWMSFSFFDLIFPFIRSEHPYLAFYVPRLAVMFFLMIVLPLMLFGWMGKWLFIIVLAVWLLAIFYFLILPLIIHRKSGSWGERYNAELEMVIARQQKDKNEAPTFQTFIGKRFGYKNLGFFIFMGFVSTTFVSEAGRSKAEKQTEFLITNSAPEMAVLRVYGENMICAPIDRNTHEVKKSFSILKMAVDPKLVMNLENVGPLKSVEKLTLEKTAPPPLPTPEAKQ